MSKNGLFIHYDYCTGCHTCEVACQQEHDFPVGKCGIKVTEYVYAADKKPVAVDYLPFPTELCDLCINRHKEGQLPACVKHCQCRCMTYGDTADLAKSGQDRKKTTILTPR